MSERIEEEAAEREGRYFCQSVKNVSLTFLREVPFRTWDQWLRKIMKPKRYTHTLGVTQTAVFLADRFGANQDRVRAAAFLHDCCKNHERDCFEKLVSKGILREADWAPSPIQHAHLGALWCRHMLGIEDEEIIHAIWAHTTGCAGMTPVDRIVYLADLIEPNRAYPGINRIRAIALQDLDEALLASMEHTLDYLAHSDMAIDPETIRARDDVKKMCSRKREEYAWTSKK
ncbi:MAG: bis(5'-nucleosyl)-tetraphosphatase (symmetrical) YqeK [Ndongobacter sp.]|nr:bis(5'-nucleosyl)-tetraphosphatase (symmetrical) YqeK [Ndongobacter sp.]